MIVISKAQLFLLAQTVCLTVDSHHISNISGRFDFGYEISTQTVTKHSYNKRMLKFDINDMGNSFNRENSCLCSSSP